jgi:RNA polymerase sigma factor (sigma-70 family)
MATTQTGVVLRHIRHLVATENTTQLRDQQLLERFITRHDEAAFDALIRRHGPLVLGVCRRVLRNWHDAEDAFQATFLILARKAGSICQRESVASWLYRVAFHTALQAKANAANRQRHERHAGRPESVDPLDEVTGRELLAVVDEELQKLPDCYRAPLVLCYLQGQTRDEAARQLGVPLGTLKRWLERGRERLRGRLARRGLTLSAGLLLTGLSQKLAVAAVPTQLAAATLQALVPAAPEKAVAAGILSTQVADLTKGVLKAMFWNKLKGVAAGLLLLSLIGAATGLLASGARTPQQAEIKTDPPRTPAPMNRGTTNLGHPHPEAKLQTEIKQHTISGIIRDGAGKPLADAAVYWLGTVQEHIAQERAAAKGNYWQDQDVEPELLAHGKSDALGRFTLQARFDQNHFRKTLLAAKAPGMGFTGQVQAGVRVPVVLTLQPEMKVEGRLLTLNGLPAKDVRVELQWMSFGKQRQPAPERHLAGSHISQGKVQPLPDWPAPVRSDEQGRFTLSGLSRTGIAVIRLTHPEYAREELMIAADPANASPPFQMLGMQIGMPTLGPKFTRTLDPGRTVQGIVTAKDTGKPLAGISIICTQVPMGFFSAKTDQEGRYRLEGLKGRKDSYYVFAVAPSPESGYRNAVAYRQGWPAGEKSLQQNFVLDRGQLVRGRILDADTRQPIAGVNVFYRAGSGNVNATSLDLPTPVYTDKQGNFVLTAVAGKGRLLAIASGKQYLREKSSGARDPFMVAVTPNRIVEIDVPADKEAPPVVIELRKGLPLEVRVVQADGKPVSHVNLLCRELGFGEMQNYADNSKLDNDLVRLHGCEPGRAYRVFFLDPERHQGAVAELKYDPNAKGPLEVRLQPTGSVRVKVVQEGGTPETEAQVLPMLWLTKEPGKIKFDDLFQDERVALYSGLEGGEEALRMILGKKTDNNGEVQLTNLLADVPLDIWAFTNAGAYGNKPVRLKPGETCDLGTITLQQNNLGKIVLEKLP